MSNTSFDPSIINEVIDKTDIVNVIKQRIPLKKKGHEWIGLCPFHQEKTPSFYVSERKQMFYCFGCHAGGNVINFITQHDHTPFVEALKQLAQLAHITLPQSQQNIDPQLQANKIKIASIMKIAQAVYHDQPQPQVIQKYLDARNINAESCQLFGLGYADEHSSTLKKTLTQQTLQLSDWINAGMNQSQKKTFRPLFFKRLMFPIHDTKGQIIAFGGRTLTAKAQPKYLNSAESILFKKGHHLYGLYQTLKSNKKIQSLFITEGYMDVIALHQHGIKNAIGTLGTAITKNQITLMIKYTKSLIFCFDGDIAGKKAAWKTVTLLLPMMHLGLTVQFIFLPDGQDPDSIIQTHGAIYFRNAYKKSISITDYFFQYLSQGIDLKTISGKNTFALACKPFLKQLPEGIFKTLLEKALNQKIGLSSHQPVPPPTKKTKSIKSKAPSVDLANIEKIMTILLNHPDLTDKVPDFSTLVAQTKHPTLQLLQRCVTIINTSQSLSTMQIIDALELDTARNYLIQIVNTPLLLDKALLASEISGLCYQLFISILNDHIETLIQEKNNQSIESEKSALLLKLLKERNHYIAILTKTD